MEEEYERHRELLGELVAKVKSVRTKFERLVPGKALPAMDARVNAPLLGPVIGEEAKALLKVELNKAGVKVNDPALQMLTSDLLGALAERVFGDRKAES